MNIETSTQPNQPEITADFVLSQIPQELRTTTDEELKRKQAELTTLPYMRGIDAEVILLESGEDLGFQMAKTNKIAGSISPVFKDWSSEIESRKGRAVDVAKRLLNPGEFGIEQTFHLQEPIKAIRLKKIDGPNGPIYFVEDGTHRVSGVKLLQMKSIPARVEDMTSISSVETSAGELKREWQRRIKAGLIDGDISERPNGSKTTYYLKIKNQALPWMSLPGPTFTKFCQTYKRLYPDFPNGLKTLKGVDITSQDLSSSEAFGYFMSKEISKNR